MGHISDPTSHEKPRWRRRVYKGYNIRRNVSFSSADMKLLEPFLARNQNNFSAAIREAIHIAYSTQEASSVRISKAELKMLLDELYNKVTLEARNQ